jgi:methylmalonyl-CoA/ethylmalonyl-CoA epimerase
MSFDFDGVGLAGRPTRLHHLGWAVPSLAAGSGIFAELLGLPHQLDELLPGVELRFFEAGECLIELLASTGTNRSIEALVDAQGGGLHHLAFAVDDVDAALRTAASAGCGEIDIVKRPGSRETQIGFVDPDWPGGVLLEFVEDAAFEPGAVRSRVT